MFFVQTQHRTAQHRHANQKLYVFAHPHVSIMTMMEAQPVF